MKSAFLPNARPDRSPARALTCLSLVWMLMSPAQAQKPGNVTAGELAILPKYCIDTMGFNYGDAYYNTSPRAPYWLGLMGKSFWAMHHHCWALIKVRRAMAPGIKPEIRQGTLLNAIADYEYVINNSTPDFIMLPEVYVKLGDAFVLVKNINAAAEAYNRSRTLKPDYGPPYVRWAEQLERMGNKKAALTHLELGLRAAPTNVEIQANYRRLGGNTEQILKSLPSKPPAVPASSADASLASEAASAASR